MKVSAGVDVGGTNAKIALLSESGRLLAQFRVPTEADRGPADFCRRLCSLLEKESLFLKARIGWVGLGLAGGVDAEAGKLLFAPNLPSWKGFAFRAALKARFGCPVTVENDANAAVWGAYMTELKGRPHRVVGLTLGTGVGGGIIIDGRLYRGATGSAGEIGHTRVENPGAPCHCGQRGCLEAYAGSYGIMRLAKRLCPAAGFREPAEISAAARRGHRGARRVWEATGRFLGVGIANLTLVLNPEWVLILGGVSQAGRWLLDPVRAYLGAQPFQIPFRDLKLRMADNLNAGCVGAALLALEGKR